MDINNFIPKCKELIVDYHNKTIREFDDNIIDESDVYVVWKSKVLHHAKALLSTNQPDGMYYEITYNGIGDEIYFDAYVKMENRLIDVKGDE